MKFKMTYFRDFFFLKQGPHKCQAAAPSLMWALSNVNILCLGGVWATY